MTSRESTRIRSMLLGRGEKRQDVTGKRLAGEADLRAERLASGAERISGDKKIERFGAKRLKKQEKRRKADLRAERLASGAERISGNKELERFGAKRQKLKKRGRQSSGDPRTPS